MMRDEEETSVDFEDVDEPPDTNYHDVMVNMTEEDKQMVNEQYSHYLDAIKEAWSMMGIGENKGGMKVMELCCEENSGLGQAVESVGGTIIRCGLFNNCDIMKKAGYAKVEQLIEKERTDILWLSLPCGATSTIQALNRLTPESREKSDKKITLARRRATRRISLVEKQIEMGGEVLQEWPKENWGWGFASIRNFWKRRHRERRYFEAQVDGCAYGLVMEGEIIKKPWIIRGTSQWVWKLERKCPGNHVHGKCEGGLRTRNSALYPVRLCQRIAHVMMGMYRDRNKEVDAVMAAEAADLDRSCLQGLTDQELAKMGQDLMRLHRRLGHPSRQALMRMLQDRGASQQLLLIAKNMVCEDCQEAHMPSAKRPTTIETANKLWQVVQTDNLMITVGDCPQWTRPGRWILSTAVGFWTKLH